MSIVLIKAALIKYGFNDLLKIKKKSDQFLVTLKDGTMLTLTKADINRINRKNRIRFTRYKDKKRQAHLRKLKEQVRFLFAVITRNLHLNGYDGNEYSESSAVKALTREGLKTDHIHALLGLERKTRNVHRLSPKHLKLFKQKKAVLLYSDEHIVVVSNGFYDNYGEAVEIGTEIPVLKGKKAKSWYEFK